MLNDGPMWISAYSRRWLRVGKLSSKFLESPSHNFIFELPYINNMRGFNCDNSTRAQWNLNKFTPSIIFPFLSFLLSLSRSVCGFIMSPSYEYMKHTLVFFTLPPYLLPGKSQTLEFNALQMRVNVQIDPMFLV
jgi:hypothetical protein